MSEVIRVEVPQLPPAECSPNWRGHWSQRAVVANRFRFDGKICALQASDFQRPAFNKAEVTVTFIIPDCRYIRDTDNALASLKPAIDGCVDAEIIRDDNPGCLTYRPPVYLVDKDRAPMTVLEFRGVE